MGATGVSPALVRNGNIQVVEPDEQDHSLRRPLSHVIGCFALFVSIPAVGVIVLMFLSIPQYPREGACGLNRAIMDGETELAQKLIAEGYGTKPCVGPSAAPYTYPAHVATEYGRLRLLQQLLEVGADPNARDEHGRTPLTLSALCLEEEHIKCLKLLIQSGADVNSASEEYGLSALHYAASDGRVDTAAFLLESGADINLAAKYGTTPLHAAATQHCRTKTETNRSIWQSPLRTMRLFKS
jgi:hypothetical protein